MRGRSRWRHAGGTAESGGGSWRGLNGIGRDERPIAALRLERTMLLTASIELRQLQANRICRLADRTSVMIVTVAMAALRFARCVPLVHFGAANLPGRHVSGRRRTPPTA